MYLRIRGSAALIAASRSVMTKIAETDFRNGDAKRNARRNRRLPGAGAGELGEGVATRRLGTIPAASPQSPLLFEDENENEAGDDYFLRLTSLLKRLCLPLACWYRNASLR